jgi:hypothetical protein
MKRRNALQLIAIGTAAPLAAQHAGHRAGGSGAAASAELRFFSPEQHALTDSIAEAIIPADERSGGAREAGVGAFIDDLLADSEPATQQLWTSGLAAIDAEAKSRFQQPFLDCGGEQRDRIVAELAANEEDPKTDLERFFVQIKRQTISGYYTSKVGLLDELDYKGGVPIAEYEPCRHRESE